MAGHGGLARHARLFDPCPVRHAPASAQRTAPLGREASALRDACGPFPGRARALPRHLDYGKPGHDHRLAYRARHFQRAALDPMGRMVRDDQGVIPYRTGRADRERRRALLPRGDHRPADAGRRRVRRAAAHHVELVSDPHPHERDVPRLPQTASPERTEQRIQKRPGRRRNLHQRMCRMLLRGRHHSRARPGVRRFDVHGRRLGRRHRLRSDRRIREAVPEIRHLSSVPLDARIRDHSRHPLCRKRRRLVSSRLPYGADHIPHLRDPAPHVHRRPLVERVYQPRDGIRLLRRLRTRRHTRRQRHRRRLRAQRRP